MTRKVGGRGRRGTSVVSNSEGTNDLVGVLGGIVHGRHTRCHLTVAVAVHG